MTTNREQGDLLLRDPNADEDVRAIVLQGAGQMGNLHIGADLQAGLASVPYRGAPSFNSPGIDP